MWKILVKNQEVNCAKFSNFEWSQNLHKNFCKLVHLLEDVVRLGFAPWLYWGTPRTIAPNVNSWYRYWNPNVQSFYFGFSLLACSKWTVRSTVLWNGISNWCKPHYLWVPAPSTLLCPGACSAAKTAMPPKKHPRYFNVINQPITQKNAPWGCWHLTQCP